MTSNNDEWITVTNKNGHNRIPRRPDSGTSSTSELLAVHKNPCGPVKENHSAPLNNNHTATNTRPAPRKKRKNSHGSMYTKYNQAVFILNRIAKNAANGTVHEKDHEDKITNQAVVDAYLKYKETMRNKNPPKPELPGSSQDGTAGASRKTSTTTTIPSTLDSRSSSADSTKDSLHLALIDELTNTVKPVMEVWSSIEAVLSELVVDHVLSRPHGPFPSFDSSEVIRGYRVIKCSDSFSKGFLTLCIEEMGDSWPNLKLKLILAKDIPKRPRARIWLPNMKIESLKLLQCLKLQNPSIPMEDWVVMKSEEPQKNSLSFLLLINEESIKALEEADHKLKFGVRHAKLKVFYSANQEEYEVESSQKCFDDWVFQRKAGLI